MPYLPFIGARVDPCKVILLTHLDELPMVNEAPYAITTNPSGYSIDTSVKQFGTGAFGGGSSGAVHRINFTGQPGGGVECVNGKFQIEFWYQRTGGTGAQAFGNQWDTDFYLEFDDGTWVQFVIGNASYFSAPNYRRTLYIAVSSAVSGYDEYRTADIDFLPDDDFHAIRFAMDGAGAFSMLVDGAIVDSGVLTATVPAGARIIDLAWGDVRTGQRMDEARVILGAADLAEYTPATGAWVDATCDSGTEEPLLCAGDTRIQAANAASGSVFATSVAMSSDGAYALAVAPLEDTAASNAGSLYAFTRTDCAWAQQQMMQTSDAAANDQMTLSSFGTLAYPAYTIAISDDGTRAVVGVSKDNTQDGAAYVFARSGTTWSQEQKLAGAVGAGDNFGYAVAMNGAGDYIAVTAPRKAATGGGDAGTIEIYTRSGSTWSHQASVSLVTGGSIDSLGTSVALSGDATTLAAGRLIGGGSAAVEVFTRSGSTWSHQSGIAPSDTTGRSAFGNSVALSTDGNTLVVGSAVHDTTVGTQRGAAYVYTRSGATWTQQVKLYDTAGGSLDYYGASVAISGDGSVVLVGAPDADNAGSQSGAVFVYEGHGTWALTHTLLGSDTTGSDHIGHTVAVSRDGDWIIAGAPTDTNSGGASAGSAYIFHLPAL